MHNFIHSSSGRKYKKGTNISWKKLAFLEMASARWVPGLDYTCISDWQLPYGSATGLSSLRSGTGCFTCRSYSSRHWGFTRSLWSCLKNRVKENCRTTQLFGAYSLKTIAHEHIGIPAIANSCFISNQDFYIWYYWVKKKKKKIIQKW